MVGGGGWPGVRGLQVVKNRRHRIIRPMCEQFTPWLEAAADAAEMGGVGCAGA
jgi:hypothetical protein